MASTTQAAMTTMLRMVEVLILGTVMAMFFAQSRPTGFVNDADQGTLVAASRYANQIDDYGRMVDSTALPDKPEASTTIRILSIDPLMIHLENFVSAAERNYLLRLAQPRFKRSTVRDDNFTRLLSPWRTSSSAYLPKQDKVVRAIAKRAAEFQGYPVPRKRIDMQVTKYEQGQEYLPHFDWFTENSKTTDRFSTFFVILEADCADCGTQFPNLDVDWRDQDPRWCTYMDCTQEVVTTKNLVGSALYWVNLNATGHGREDMLHAGLPLRNGTKIGLNIWTEIG